MNKRLTSMVILFFAVLLISVPCGAAGAGEGTDGFNPGLINSLEARIKDNTFRDINSILIFRNGRVLAESYFNGDGPDTLHDIRSAGKSVTSALVGIAIDKGFITGVDEKLMSYYPGIECPNGWDPVKNRITLKHVLMMSFGLAEPGPFPAWENRSWYTIDWKRDVLCQGIEFEPGSRFDYDSAAPALFGPIIEQSSGISVGNFAEKYLFQPLGITHYRWHIMPDGHEYTGGGFRMSTRDMARFGQLYLQNGTWQGTQVISENWVKASTRAHLTAYPHMGLYYGYFWWRESFPVNGHRIETFSASGNGGNKIYVFPTEDLVVAVTASAYNKSYGHMQVRMMMNSYILPAVIQGGEAEAEDPVIKTVPRTGFILCEIVFLVSLVLCILWPSGMFARPSGKGAAEDEFAQNNVRQSYIARIWIGLTAVIGIIFIGMVMKEAPMLDIWLNCGYDQPVRSAPYKVIAGWAFTILTAGLLFFSVKSFKNGYWSRPAAAWFSIVAVAALYGLAQLEYLGLLLFK